MADKTILWPFVLYAAVALILVIAMITLSYFLGQRHSDRTTDEPYECGMPSTGSAWSIFNISYYLIAMFFVIFDLEAVFILAWAVALREAGWAGFIEIAVFTFILMAALIYVWRSGALDWGSGDVQDHCRPKKALSE